MKKDLSIVIPVLNEEESLDELVVSIKNALKGSKKTYEIVFVDDGSTDGSLDLLKEMAKENKDIKVYSFRRNLGKSPAMMFGFKVSNAKFVLTMDADLQDDPANIELLFEKMESDKLDLVTGWRKYRKDSLFKIYTSKIFNGFVSFLFGVKLNDLNSGLKLYKEDLAKEIRIYGGMHRFVPIIASEMGYRVGEKDIVHHARKHGTSKYKFTKVFTDIPDLMTIFFLTKYNRRPLHFFGQVGTFIFLLGAIPLSYLFVLRIQGETIGDRPLLLFGILLVLVGIQIVLTGLIADLFVNQNEKNTDNYPIKYEG